MVLERTSVPMQNQIIELYQRGDSIRKISRSLKKCRKTVRHTIRQWESNENAPPEERSAPSERSSEIDWENLVLEDQKGVPVKTLWQEQNTDMTYRQFWGELRKRRPVVKPVTIKLHHSPGEKAQIDFCDGISIIDKKTGEPTKTHLFLATLPFSSMAFAEFSLNQKLDTFLDLQDKAFASFGGIPKYLVPDNLKSGVRKAHRYDPDSNPTYCDYANHMGFSVLPARPYSPKDKANVESQIGLIQRSFFSRVRNKTFHTLLDLNRELKLYMEELLSSEMKDYGVSRLERFQYEKAFLQPIPEEKFERREWKTCKVHPDCHIQVNRQFYSVPHSFVSRQVQARVSSRLIEVFDEDMNSIATHGRLQGNRGQYSTNDKHYPEEQVGVARYEVKHAKKSVQKIGPKTKELIEDLLSGPHPLKFLRRVQGILRLYTSKKVGRDAMEYASIQALSFNRKNFSYFQSCAKHFEANGARPISAAPHRDLTTTHLTNNQ